MSDRLGGEEDHRAHDGHHYNGDASCTHSRHNPAAGYSRKGCTIIGTFLARVQPGGVCRHERLDVGGTVERRELRKLSCPAVIGEPAAPAALGGGWREADLSASRNTISTCGRAIVPLCLKR
jgi:hypothetical protein